TIYHTNKLKLDKDGNVIERIQRYVDGQVKEIVTTTYRSGYVVDETAKDASGKLIRRTEINIAGDGNAKSMKFYDGNSEVSSIRFEYSDFDKYDNWTTRMQYNAE